MLHKNIRNLLFISALLTASAANAFEFYSANNAATYNITNISSQLSKQYKRSVNVYAVLVAASSINNTMYKDQFAQLSTLNAETHALIYISATSDKEVASGYHTTELAAKSILNGNAFKVIIYSPKAKIITQSSSVLSASKILEFTKKHNNSLKTRDRANRTAP